MFNEPNEQEKAEFMEQVEIDQAKALLEKHGYYIKRMEDGVKFIEGMGIV